MRYQGAGRFLAGFTIIAFLIGCQENSRINNNNSASTPPQPVPSQIESLPTSISSNVTEKSAAPKIIRIEFPESILSNSEFGNGTVTFKDSDGDIHSAQFTLAEGGCMEFEYFAFDPMEFIYEGDHFSGQFQFRQTCEKCPESPGDMLVMQVQLFDRKAHASDPIYYQFLCK